jgi:hypothetical protein
MSDNTQNTQKMPRIAIKAEWERKSESTPGFYKYIVTIREEDGEIVKSPVYGRNMQDALSRIVRHERSERIVRKTEKIPAWVYLLLFFMTMGTGSILSYQQNSPIYFGAGVGLLLFALGTYQWRTRD